MLSSCATSTHWDSGSIHSILQLLILDFFVIFVLILTAPRPPLLSSSFPFPQRAPLTSSHFLMLGLGTSCLSLISPLRGKLDFDGA